MTPEAWGKYILEKCIFKGFQTQGYDAIMKNKQKQNKKQIQEVKYASEKVHIPRFPYIKGKSPVASVSTESL